MTVTTKTWRPSGTRPAVGTDVLVVGGGIGGLAAALALTRAGQRVRVLEQAAAFGEVGAGLQLAPNATRILREWGVLDEVRELGVAPRRMVMRDAVDGSELTSLDLTDVQRRYGAPYLVIHRTDLHSTLLEACRRAGVDLVTNAKVTDVEVDTDHAAAAGDSRRDVGQVLIAADARARRRREPRWCGQPSRSRSRSVARARYTRRVVQIAADT